MVDLIVSRVEEVLAQAVESNVVSIEVVAQTVVDIGDVVFNVYLFVDGRF